MYELSKQILEKVSFDRKLFKKELIKAINWLKDEEKMLLRMWCIATFGNVYGDVIREVFKNTVKA
jgi:hypothetical protein